MPGPVSFFDRPSVALANLYKGKPLGALKGLVAPSSLSPSQTQTLSDLLEGEAQHDPLLKGIMEVFSDPFFVVGALLSFRYPVAKLRDAFTVGKKWAGSLRRVGWVEKLLGRGEMLLRDTNIPKNVMQLAMEKRNVEQAWLVGNASGFVPGHKNVKALSAIMEELQQGLGRAPTPQELNAIGIKLDGWADGIPYWSKRVVESVIGRPLRKPYRKFVWPSDPSNHAALDRAYTRFRGWHDAAFDDLIRPFLDRKQDYNVSIALGRSPAEDLVPGLRAGAIKVPKEYAEESTRRYLKDYLFHVPKRNTRADLAFMKELEEQATREVREFDRLADASAKNWSPRPTKVRKGMLVPDVDEMRQIPGFDPGFADDIAEFTAKTQKKFREGRMQLPGVDQIIHRLKTQGGTPEVIQGTLNDVKQILQEAGAPVARYRTELGRIRIMMEQSKLNEAVREIDRVLEGATAVSKYSFNPFMSSVSYVHGISNPYAWSIKGPAPGVSYGQAILKETDKLDDARRAIMRDYIPMFQGRMNSQQLKGMLHWNNTRMWAIDKLREPWASKLVPKFIREPLIAKLAAPRGPFSYMHASSSTASWFYLSTLAGNPSSAFKNTLQNVITGYPQLGKHQFEGMAAVAHKLTKKGGFFDLKAAGKTTDEALEIVFPEFAKTNLHQTSLTKAILTDSLDKAWTTGIQSIPENLSHLAAGSRPWQKAVDKAKRVGMGLFSGSEQFNRLSTFEGGLLKARAEGFWGPAGSTIRQQAIEAAETATRATQFAAGHLQMPHGLLNLPAPLRQFMYFPIRFFGFLWESTRMPWGKGPFAAPYSPWGGRNWGTIGRSMAASSAAYHGAKNLLNMDLSQGLMWGALPLPTFEGAPFFPAPVVPPLISEAGLLAQAAFTEDPEALERAAALGVPGGIAAHRAYKYLVRGAQYDQMGPDGKIPVYNRTGSKVADYTPMQLYMQALGLGRADVQMERDMTGYIMKQRDKIRDYRRQYVNAIVDNEHEKAQEIQEGFQAEYPELGPLTVKKSDITAVKRRRDLTRLERLLMTLPADYRGVFQQIVNTSMAADFGQIGAVPTVAPRMSDVYSQGLNAYSDVGLLPSAPGLGAGMGWPSLSSGNASPVSFGAPGLGVGQAFLRP